MRPSVKQVMRLVRDAGLFPAVSLRARRILHAYGAHYRRARALSVFSEATPVFASLQDVRVRVLRPGGHITGLRVPDLSTVVRRLRSKVDARPLS